MVTCWHCKAESPAAHYERITHNKTALYGPWLGWRLAGRFLIGPLVRITPERLSGIAWRDRVSPVERTSSTGAHIVPFLRSVDPGDAA
jgi:hypothetical protein